MDFRGFLTTKVSTTWLRPACCLGKSGQCPAVSRKRTRPQHFQSWPVRKCAKKLFWPTLPETPPPPPHPTPSALCMLPGRLLAHSDLMAMRSVDSWIRDGAADGIKTNQPKAIGLAKRRKLLVWVRGGGGVWGGVKQEALPFHFLPLPCVPHCISPRSFSLAGIKREQMCFRKKEGAGGVWPVVWALGFRGETPPHQKKKLFTAQKRTRKNCKPKTQNPNSYRRAAPLLPNSPPPPLL